MKRFAIIIAIFLFVSGMVWAITYPSLIWVSTNKNSLKINDDGSITLNIVASSSKAPVLIGYPSVTIISTNTYKIDISSDGCLNLNTF